MNCVLKHWHPMVGIDIHILWPPGSPAPTNPAPFKTGQLLVGLAPGVFSKPIKSHLTDSYAISMEMNTDIGSLIPHIGVPSVTLPIEMAFSYSKSYFGASRYLAEGKIMACAVLFCVNTNLNCGTPVPTPTGFVIAMTTHIVYMSFADWAAGVARMAVDAAVQAALSFVGGAVGGAIGKRIASRLSPSTWLNAYCAAANRGLPDWMARFNALNAVLEAGRRSGRIGEAVAGFFLGGPLGADMGTLGGPTIAGGTTNAMTGDSEKSSLAESEGGVGRIAREWAESVSPTPPPAVTDYTGGEGAPPVLN